MTVAEQQRREHTDSSKRDNDNGSNSLESYSLPREINSPQAKLVYLFLDVSNGATPTELRESLGLKKITVLGILGTLEDRDLVDRTGARYVSA